MPGRREAIFNGRGEISGVHHVLRAGVKRKMRIAGLETATVNQQHERPRSASAWLQRFPVQRCAVIGNAVSFCLLSIRRYAVKGEARGLSVDTEFLAEQNATVDRLCHLLAQIQTSNVVSAEVLPCVNTAQSRFLRRGRETSEVSCYSWQRLGANIERESVAEVKAQHGRARFTDCAVCSGVGRIRSRVGG